MIERLDINAPGRAGFAEVMDPRLTHVRVASRSVLLEALGRNQRADARLNCRARDRADERTHDERASVSHPHGEASGPGAWSLRTDAKKTQFGGTRSHSSDVLVFAFVCAGDDRGEVTYVNESVNEDADFEDADEDAERRGFSPSASTSSSHYSRTPLRESWILQRLERTELC